MSLFPVSELLDTLFDNLRSSNLLLLSAPTGAGKSTWLPLQFLNTPLISGRIILLEPRRLAARNIAYRLAQQLGQQPGETVGYRMRAESRVSHATRLEVVTEGVLTRQLQRDPLLQGVGLVILDEFHERSLQSDLALALLRDVQQGLREDLKLLIMSATLDNSRLQQLLPAAPLLSSPGRSYPVQREFRPLPAHQRFEQAVAASVCQLLQQNEGSLLLFLPGVAEIRRVAEQLAERHLPATDLCLLYGALPLHQQQQAIQPSPTGRRKVVLATNIAESSLTIEGISLVVDSALEREARFEPRSGLIRLTTQRISKASMIQRAGRAGRTAPGICWHLLSKEQAERCSEQAEPEILHTDLSGLRMELLQWGCMDPTQLSWLDQPPPLALAAARDLLTVLGAIAPSGLLNERGRSMAALGCDPRLAAILQAGAEQGPAQLATAALIAAIVEEPPRSGDSDLSHWLAQPQSHWQRRAQQLIRRTGRQATTVDPALAPVLLAYGFPDRIAHRRGEEGRYLLANGLGATLDSDQPLSRAPWLVAAQLLQGANSPNARILLALPVDIESLVQQLPHLLTEQSAIEWEAQKGTLQAWRRWQIGSLVLKSSPLRKPSMEDLQTALLGWIRTQGLTQLPWDDAASQLRQRLLCAKIWLPEIAWPAADEQSLLDGLEQWLLPFLDGVSELRGLQRVNLYQALESLLSWQLKQQLDQELPTHYTVPSGSRLPIRYDSGHPPLLAVRLQEVFGASSTPRIAQGRVPLVLELLSPARRPLQITADLAAFWQGAYSEVQKEMKGRYPKHQWPDDPVNAIPSRRTTKPR